MADKRIPVVEGRTVEILEGREPAHEHFVDLVGTTFMPRLIDFQVHAIITTVDQAT